MPTGSAQLPDPREWSGKLVQGLLEVLGGDRPVAQLSRWLGHEVYVELQRRVRASARSCPPHLRRARRGAVRSLPLCHPADGVVEVAAMVAGAGRAAAVAMRLEGRDGRWLCTALELG
ncbi:MAG: Rv3235 family protein [Actinomycetes bacterium]